MIFQLLMLCMTSISLFGMDTQRHIQNSDSKKISVIYYPGLSQDRVKIECNGVVFTLTERGVTSESLESLIRTSHSRNQFYRFSIAVDEQKFNKFFKRCMESAENNNLAKIFYTSNAAYNVGNELEKEGLFVKPEVCAMSPLCLAVVLYAASYKRLGIHTYIPVTQVQRYGYKGWWQDGGFGHSNICSEMMLSFFYVYTVCLYAQALFNH